MEIRNTSAPLTKRTVGVAESVDCCVLDLYVALGAIVPEAVVTCQALASLLITRHQLTTRLQPHHAANDL